MYNEVNPKDIQHPKDKITNLITGVQREWSKKRGNNFVYEYCGLFEHLT